MIFKPSHWSKEVKSHLNEEFANLAILYHNEVILIDIIDIPDIVKVLLNNYFKMAKKDLVKEVVDEFNKQLNIYKNENI